MYTKKDIKEAIRVLKDRATVLKNLSLTGLTESERLIYASKYIVTLARVKELEDQLKELTTKE